MSENFCEIEVQPWQKLTWPKYKNVIKSYQVSTNHQKRIQGNEFFLTSKKFWHFCSQFNLPTLSTIIVGMTYSRIWHTYSRIWHTVVPERLTHFRYPRNPENVSIFPGQRYNEAEFEWWISRSTPNRLKKTSLKFRVVQCPIQILKTLISKMKRLGSGLRPRKCLLFRPYPAWTRANMDLPLTKSMSFIELWCDSLHIIKQWLKHDNWIS